MPQWLVGRAQRRLIVALGVSVAFHVWLMHSHYGRGMARGSAEGARVVARLLPLAAETGPAAPPSAQTMEAQERVKSIAPEWRAANASVPTTLSLNTAATAPRAAPITTTVLSQPSDPNYYAAGDLDVFPKALVKPDLTAVIGASHEPAAGKVRATVLIDEAGVVNAVRNLEAPAGDIEAAARELLLRTRFTPARNKEGRIVKAQVLVALEYDTRSAPAAR